MAENTVTWLWMHLMMHCLNMHALAHDTSNQICLPQCLKCFLLTDLRIWMCGCVITDTIADPPLFWPPASRVWVLKRTLKARPPSYFNGLFNVILIGLVDLMDWLIDGLSNPMFHSFYATCGGRGPLQPRPPACCLTSMFYRLFKKRGKPCSAKTERAGASG